jgi:cold shock protein
MYARHRSVVTGQESGVMTEVKGSTFQGKVKWFNDQKGFGFIARENEPDVFVHHSVINMEGFRTLREGEEVTYELTVSDKGASAVNVNRVSL